MKPALLGLSIIFCLCVIAAPVQAANLALPAKKLKEGVTDIITAPVNLATSTAEQIDRTEGDGIWHGPFLGLAAGIMEGTASMIGQAFEGTIKILTFPLN